jgi:diguanylate cyclase (GGDEF)-like protein/PAS domain S-box-containing protein
MSLIVIIDDRATNLAIYSRLAKAAQKGVTVRTFRDPEAALAWLADCEADLVVTDYKMPSMTGAEFTRTLRAMPLGPEVPVVVITAYHDKSFRLEALEAGATDFLESPVQHAEFTTRIRNLLKMSWQHKVIRDRATILERELSTTRRSHDEVIRESRERLAQVIDTVPAMISATDRDGKCIFVNAFQARMAGFAPREITGEAVQSIFGGAHAAAGFALDQSVLQTGQALPSFEETVTNANGAVMTLLTTKSPLRDATGEVVGVLTTSTDITDRKIAEQQLLFVAKHDYLTGLPNRAHLQERLQQEVETAQQSTRVFALHLIDLDQFKSVNDGLGHHYGDRLLKIVAARLRDVVRQGDLVARIGGDEFAILQTVMRHHSDSTRLAARVIETLRDPIQLDEHEVFIGASVGITSHPDDGADPDELLQNADIAMYRAKLAGRNCFSLFSDDMLLQAKDTITLRSALQRALSQREFTLHYQPQVNLRSGKIIGAEALLRWERPDGTLLAPAEFLSVAEQSGLILGAGEWVLHEACARAAEWAKAGTPIRVAVNLSPLQFKRCDVRELVLGALAATGLPPHLLDLELTEHILVEHGDGAAAQIADLQKHGVFISVDDFGVGYSSLKRLMSLRVDRLKIDRSLVGDLAEDSQDTAIVRAIIAFGRALDVEVLAEGVETAEQVRRLVREGCSAVQGFFFSHPLAAPAFDELLRRWVPHVSVTQTDSARVA